MITNEILKFVVALDVRVTVLDKIIIRLMESAPPETFTKSYEDMFQDAIDSLKPKYPDVEFEDLKK